MTREQMMASRRLAGQVVRWHTWPMLHRDTVAEHSWQVMRVYHELFGCPPTEVFETILWDDSLELHTGDLPFPVKAKYPSVKSALINVEANASKVLKIHWPELTDLQRRQIKISDLCEMWQAGKQELMMGNQYGGPIVTGIELALSIMTAGNEDLEQHILKWMEEHRV